MDFSMKTSVNNVKEPSTCNFTGSETESGKDNFWYIGCLEKIIWNTISPNTTASAVSGYSEAHISSPQKMTVSMHATWQLMTYDSVFISSPPRHGWEIPGNYPVLTVLMVVYHYVERIWIILVTPIFYITYIIINIYYPDEPVDIYIQ